MSRVDASIRPAVPSDAADLAALARRVFATTYGMAIRLDVLCQAFTVSETRIGIFAEPAAVLTED